MEEIVQQLEQVLGNPDFQVPFGPPTILVGGGLENYFRTHTTSHKLMEQTNAFVFPETARWRNVKEFCSQNSIRFPSSTRKLSVHQKKRRWLVKTNSSSGGIGVQFARSNVALEPEQYLQEYIDGRSISACYVVGAVDEGEEFPVVEMLGVCEPVPSSALDVRGQESEQTFPFRYAGSIGPINPARLAGPISAEFKRVGSLVANHFGLAGVFGIDFVLEQNNLWLLEINPRITASAELIEYAVRETMPDFTIVQLHLDAQAGKVGRKSVLIEACHSANWDRIFAKQIVYRHHEATQPLRVMRFHLDALESQFGSFSRDLILPSASGPAFITDVPKRNTDILAEHPILTLHASGESQSETEQVLARSREVLETILGERLS